MQYHEVITELCGKFLGAVTLFFVMLNVLGITVAQVVACSSDAYYYRQVLLSDLPQIEHCCESMWILNVLLNLMGPTLSTAKGCAGRRHGRRIKTAVLYHGMTCLALPMPHCSD